jgi:hypothetical protein
MTAAQRQLLKVLKLIFLVIDILEFLVILECV